jgi:hypothetical protein
VPPPRGGLFWQKISQGVLSGISLVQVVQCVKNSSIKAAAVGSSLLPDQVADTLLLE